VETRAQFLAALENPSLEAIISDFNLPAFDGLEALRLTQARRPDLAFLLVTGPRSEAVAVECMREGADDYILKDSLKRLPSALQNALRKKAAERERAWAEAELQRSEEQFRLITESTRDLVALLDADGRFLYANPSYEKILGYAPAHLLGTDAFALVHPDDREVLRPVWREALRAKDPHVTEVRLQRRRGDWLFFETIGHWILDAAGRAERSVLVSRDITRRKQAEEKLRSLPRLVVEAQEAERRRVARELHDSVNQILGSVRFRVESMKERLPARDEGLREEARKVGALLEKAIEEVRRISHNLRPSELDDLGLVPAVRSLCREFSGRTGLRVAQTFDGVPDRCSKEVELTLYRIIQEALTNIERHAGATAVELRLARRGAAIQASIADNGAGFSPQSVASAAPGRGGMGLLDMQERAGHLGGTCAVTSKPGQGTQILVTLPWSAETNLRQRTRERQPSPKNQSPAGG
jgi:two-component system sensor histidine kinase UhpB